ncbi:MAG: hypothetical protein AAF826_04845 [Pseudomonadota bacterium]
MATFPPREKTMLMALESLLHQVDKIFLCLNEYPEKPSSLPDSPKLVVKIPDVDLKDLGKFAFDPHPNDIVFTCDDDIIYSENYVSHSLKMANAVDFEQVALGYHAERFSRDVGVSSLQRTESIQFPNALENFQTVDLLGTGTTFMLGENMPSLSDVKGALGFVDVRFARFQLNNNRQLIAAPRPKHMLRRNLGDAPRSSTLFRSFHLRRPPDLVREQELLLQALRTNAT